MIDIEYFDQFEDESLSNDKNKSEKLSDWVSDRNSSLAAYLAIQSLFKVKMSYIRSHRKKSHYVKKGEYQISKSEVARAAGKDKPNALFHSVDYAPHLTKEFDTKNRLLQVAKEKTLENSSHSLKDLSKSELQSKVKGRDRYKELAKLKADEIVDLALERMPLNVRKQLHLI
jgi:hypothetical protein